MRRLERIGLRIEATPPAGMFLWVDAGMDTNVLATRGLAQGLLLAPGCLFSPSQLPSTRMRLNITALPDPAVDAFLERELGAR